LIYDSRWFLSYTKYTLAALVNSWASVSIYLTVSSIIENFPVKFNLEPEEAKFDDDCINDPVLLKIVDCICAYLFLLI